MLLKKQALGQYKATLSRRNAKESLEKERLKKAIRSIKSIYFSKEILKLCCALMWWCEGEKTLKYVKFVSSDTTLVANFLNMFRSGFQLEESKFRALIHLHDYHNDQSQKNFWSEITKIPLSQFHKSYQKKSSHVRKKENYPGCIAITYYDAKIAKKLAAIYNAFSISRGVR